MGLKLSCIHRGSLSRQVSLLPAPARVISPDGSLKELSASRGVNVSDVLGADDASSSFVVCNSDALYFNELPPAMSPGNMLRPGQIYFMLPASMLGRPLSGEDMAALAVRASAALASSSSKPRHGRGRGGKNKKKVRVMPVGQEDVELFNEKLNEQTLGQYFGVLLSPARSNEKLAAAEARSPLKRALSIIREDAE